jgi:hypothetical protein
MASWILSTHHSKKLNCYENVFGARDISVVCKVLLSVTVIFYVVRTIKRRLCEGFWAFRKGARFLLRFRMIVKADKALQRL